MPNIEIISVGKIKADWIRAGVAHYKKLLSKYRSVDFVIVREAPKNASAAEAVSTESARIAERLVPKGFNLILDATGRHYSSESLAGFLQEVEAGGMLLRFMVGGAFGIAGSVKKRADCLLSLSDFTLPHELAQVVLLEQLYRAYSIIAGAKYHK